MKVSNTLTRKALTGPFRPEKSCNSFRSSVTTSRTNCLPTNNNALIKAYIKKSTPDPHYISEGPRVLHPEPWRAGRLLGASCLSLENGRTSQRPPSTILRKRPVCRMLKYLNREEGPPILRFPERIEANAPIPIPNLSPTSHNSRVLQRIRDGNIWGLLIPLRVPSPRAAEMKDL